VSLRVRLVINWSNLEASLLSMSTPAGLVRLLSLWDMSGVLVASKGENWCGVGGLLGQEELLELERVAGLAWGLRDCLWTFQAESRLGLPSLAGLSIVLALRRIFLYISILDWVQSKSREASATALRDPNDGLCAAKEDAVVESPKAEAGLLSTVRPRLEDGLEKVS